MLNPGDFSEGMVLVLSRPSYSGHSPVALSPVSITAGAKVPDIDWQEMRAIAFSQYVGLHLVAAGI